MIVRFYGGPMHRKVGEAKHDGQVIQRIKPRKKKYNIYDNIDPFEMLERQSGTYWVTPERDKQGHPIMAWTGWK